MTTITPAEVAALVASIDALAEKALPQPWSIDPDDRPGMHWNNQIVQASDPNMAVCFMTHDNTPENEQGQANAELIVALVKAWPALSAALTHLAAARKDAERLDWLEANEALVNTSGMGIPHVSIHRSDDALDHFYGDTYRDAIDSAMTLPTAPETP